MRQGDQFQITFYFLRKKQSGQHLDFNVFWQTLTWIYKSQDMLNFDFV